MPLDYRPLVYFWVAEYKDGTALPQFDPETGEENRFADVDQSKLKAFGWYPFNFALAQKIYEREGLIVIPSNNSIHRIELKNGEILIAKREQEIIQFGYHTCLACGHRWQFGKDQVNPKVGLPVSKEVYIEEIEVSTDKGKKMIKWVNPICPRCGYHDLNEILRSKKQIRKFTGVKRETVYILGKLDDDVKRIKEDGSTE